MRTYFKRGLTALIVAAALLPPVPVLAQGAGSCGLRPVIPMTSSSETLTVSNTAKVLTASKYSTSTASASMAVIDVETDAIRYWDDTTVPTATTGHKVTAGSQFIVCGILAVRQLQMIRVSTDATAIVSYYQ